MRNGIVGPVMLCLTAASALPRGAAAQEADLRRALEQTVQAGTRAE